MSESKTERWGVRFSPKDGRGMEWKENEAAARGLAAATCDRACEIVRERATITIEVVPK